MVKCEILETSRLRLRMVTPATYQEAFSVLNEEQLALFFGLNGNDLEEERRRLAGGMHSYQKTLLIFHLIEKESGKMIGWCGYHTWYLRHHRAEIGYAIFSESDRNKGYMSEALKAILNYGFTEMKLNRIEAFVAEDNIPSMKLMKSFGFTKEGCMRGHYYTNNRHEDSLAFSLLRKEAGFPEFE